MTKDEIINLCEDEFTAASLKTLNNLLNKPNFNEWLKPSQGFAAHGRRSKVVTARLPVELVTELEAKLSEPITTKYGACETKTAAIIAGLMMLLKY